jgi:hypothetical protein
LDENNKIIKNKGGSKETGQKLSAEKNKHAAVKGMYDRIQNTDNKFLENLANFT